MKEVKMMRTHIEVGVFGERHLRILEVVDFDLAG